jgi:hypothetical protein
VLSSASAPPRRQYFLTESDSNDGFVHLSTATQVPGVLERYFADIDSVDILRIDVDRLSTWKRVTWDKATNDEGELDWTCVVWDSVVWENTRKGLDQELPKTRADRS